MRNFKDESFIGQYLSPKVIRDLRLFAILDDEHQEHLRVSAIHDTQGYREVREALSQAVRPRVARARHPGLERQPARRPLADAAPHAAQQPAAARRRQRGAEARRPPVGLRRQPRKRRPVGRRERTLVDRSSGGARPTKATPAASTPPSRREGLGREQSCPGARLGRSSRLQREDLPGVHDVLRVEGALDGSHHVDRVGAGLARSGSSILCRPTPCSPLQVPSMRERAHAPRFSFSCSASSRSSGLVGSTR